MPGTSTVAAIAGTLARPKDLRCLPQALGSETRPGLLGEVPADVSRKATG